MKVKDFVKDATINLVSILTVALIFGLIKNGIDSITRREVQVPS